VLKLCSQVVPSLSQSAVPLPHDASEQTPPEHIRLSLTPQAAAHAPQFALVSSGVSQPSLSAVLQLPKPAWHATKLHVPVEHPEVLLSGHHEQIRRWRLQQALGRTWLRRPELIAARRLSGEEQKLLEEFRRQVQERSEK
jgi:hypothetical protein